VPHCSNDVWRYGAQYCRVDGCPGDLCFWRSVVACLVSVQEQFQGWRYGSFPFGRRPYADSRVQLTGGRKAHNSRRGGVLSPRTPTASGMALQYLGWCCGGRDGRTGPMVTDETRLTGPTSRRCLGRARNRRSSPFRGFRRPSSRVWRAGRMRLGGIVSRS
jgi:hypothetical protein